MKQLLLIIVLSLYACKPTEITISENVKTLQKKSENNKQIVEKTELIPNQNIKIINDEWGKKYVKLLPGEHTVLKYVYTNKVQDDNIMDAGYTQILWFDLGEKFKNKTYSSKNLEDNPLYVQITGFRNSQLIPVKNAKIETKILSKNNLQILIHIPSQFPQILKREISQTIDIKQ